MSSLVQVVLRKTSQEILNKKFILTGTLNVSSLPGTTITIRCKTTKSLSANAFVAKEIKSVAQSLASKGFLRPNKPYKPPDNYADKLENIFAKLNIPGKNGKYAFPNLEEKFKILNECFSEFQHAVSNSQIYEMKTIADIRKYYKTPVDTTVPFDAMKKIELPENLHIHHEYVRFHPETDTMFGGKSAFPKSSTLVTGLKYREKYRGHFAKRSWP